MVGIGKTSTQTSILGAAVTIVISKWRQRMQSVLCSARFFFFVWHWHASSAHTRRAPLAVISNEFGACHLHTNYESNDGMRGKQEVQKIDDLLRARFERLAKGWGGEQRKITSAEIIILHSIFKLVFKTDLIHYVFGLFFFFFSLPMRTKREINPVYVFWLG